MSTIFGIGTDIVQIARIQKIVLQYGPSFAKRILSIEEDQQYQLLSLHQRVHYLAKRFAGKEAVAKALGIGIAKGIAFKHISITNNELGQPMVSYLDAALQYIIQNNIKQTFISLADERDFALAFVTITV